VTYAESDTLKLARQVVRKALYTAPAQATAMIDQNTMSMRAQFEDLTLDRRTADEVAAAVVFDFVAAIKTIRPDLDDDACHRAAQAVLIAYIEPEQPAS
jgi:hypothetical protein